MYTYTYMMTNDQCCWAAASFKLHAKSALMEKLNKLNVDKEMWIKKH